MNRLSPATVVAWIFVHAFQCCASSWSARSSARFLRAERAPHRPMHWTILGSGARPAARSRHSSLRSIASRDHFCRRRGMRQSLWRRAWRRLLVYTVEGCCFLNRERKDVWSYAILGERLCAPRMFLVVSADQGAEAVRMVVNRKTCAPAPVISFIRPISTVRTRSGHRRN